MNKALKNLDIEKIRYQDLDAKMKETYNFQKASGILAEYGFVTNLLKYDWKNADFLAQHKNGEWLKIQLKGRLTCSPKYMNNNLFIMFQDKNSKNEPWYLFPHDDFMNYVKTIKPRSSAAKKGFSSGNISIEYKGWLKDYIL